VKVRAEGTSNRRRRRGCLRVLREPRSLMRDDERDARRLDREAQRRDVRSIRPRSGRRRIRMAAIHLAGLAQLGSEHAPRKREVLRSNRRFGTNNGRSTRHGAGAGSNPDGSSSTVGDRVLGLPPLQCRSSVGRAAGPYPAARSFDPTRHYHFMERELDWLSTGLLIREVGVQVPGVPPFLSASPREGWQACPRRSPSWMRDLGATAALAQSLLRQRGR
jgi:hypothetical protein